MHFEQRWKELLPRSEVRQVFKKMWNLAKLDIKLTPEGPFLIKAQEGLDPTRPEMEFVRLTTPFGESLYVPGSSLKGVIRSASEALLRSLGQEVCDPTNTAPDSEDGICPQQKRNRGKKRDEKLPYEDHCNICKTFGSTELAGRMSFRDLLPWRVEGDPSQRMEAVAAINRYLSVRPGIALDRRKGSVAHGPFEMEVLSGGDFYGEVVARNYALWQLGLLFFVFERLDEGTLRLGFGKSRGLGRVRVTVERMLIEQFGTLAQERDGRYMIQGAPQPGEEEEITLALPEEIEPRDTGLSLRFEFTGEELKGLKEQLIDHFKRRYQR